MRLVLIISFFISFFNLPAQTPRQVNYHPALWQKSIDIQPAISGGYIMLSNISDSVGDNAILITKFDTDLNISWEKELNEIDTVEGALGFFQDSNGNIFIGGIKHGSSFITIKTDSLGNLLWSSAYFIPDVTPIQMSGNENQGFYFMGTKPDSAGDTILAVNFDTSGIFQSAPSVFRYNYKHITAVNSVLSSIGFGVCWLLWGSLTGHIAIEFFNGAIPIGGIQISGGFPYQTAPEFNSIRSTASGGFLIAGSSFSGQDHAPTIQVLNSNGATVSTSPFDYPGRFINCISVHDGGYAVIGKTTAFPHHFHLIKMDSLLNVEWAFEYPDAQLISAEVILEVSNGNFLLVGQNSQYQIALIITDSLGNSYCSSNSYPISNLPGGSTDDAIGAGATILYTAIGSQYNPQSSLISGNHLDTICLYTSTNNFQSGNLNLSPSIANSNLTIRVENEKMKSINIINSIGKNLFHTSISHNVSTYLLNVSFLQPGLYFLQAETDHRTVTKKFIMK